MEVPANNDLDTAIEQLVQSGERDPLDIARKLINQHGQTWARLEVAARAEDLIADLARRKLGSVKKQGTAVVQTLRPGSEISADRLRIAKVWIPGEGWKRAAELTVSDCLKRASFYRLLSDTAQRRAGWYQEVASLMEAEGAKTLGQLKAELPALPTHEELLQLGAGS